MFHRKWIYSNIALKYEAYRLSSAYSFCLICLIKKKFVSHVYKRVLTRPLTFLPILLFIRHKVILFVWSEYLIVSRLGKIQSNILSFIDA
jgi:hypothetical protein